MIKRLLIVSFFCFACTSILPGQLRAAEPAPAKEADAETTKAAEELIETMDMGRLIHKSIESTLETQMSQFAEMGMSREGVAELKQAMLGFMKDVMNWDDLKPEFVRIYAEAFTASELRDLSTFYKTPAGKKSLEKMPELMNKGMAMGQERMMTRQEDLQKLITPIMEKYMKDLTE
ncbi:MAG TPA: DUF2059 domain-containing protein [Luteolibacter sp.]|nr:DUF2059 domain-containing protein [Luteolibacter sp.]